MSKRGKKGSGSGEKSPVAALDVVPQKSPPVMQVVTTTVPPKPKTAAPIPEPVAAEPSIKSSTPPAGAPIPGAPPVAPKEPAAPPPPLPTLLFEIAWEVCWQLGGIYTVLRTKAGAMLERWDEGSRSASDRSR